LALAPEAVEGLAAPVNERLWDVLEVLNVGRAVSIEINVELRIN
jgi:hypothetical protein